MTRYLTLIVMMCGALYGAWTAVSAFAMGTSAVHEIEALIAVLIVAVVASAVYIGECVRSR